VPEALVRDALRAQVLTTIAGARGVVDEFWVPRSNERADLAVIGTHIDGFEIKTERDTLRRLPRQASAYARLFDRCIAVVAARHHDAAAELLPAWWGLTTVSVNGCVTFVDVRPARPNPAVDPETLVRLLWRDEAMAALARIGGRPDPGASRASLWAQLLAVASLGQLRAAVRHALLTRDPAAARLPTRRFRERSPAVALGL
jgi:hypothetical protein